MKTIIILMIVLTTGIAWAFTWEGELDPNEFDKWELVSIIPNPQGFSWVMIKNPDQSSPIDVVAMLVDSSSNVLGYRYFKDNEPYGYFFDIAQQKYVRHQYSPEQKKGCMQCHSDKVATHTSI